MEFFLSSTSPPSGVAATRAGCRTSQGNGICILRPTQTLQRPASPSDQQFFLAPPAFLTSIADKAPGACGKCVRPVSSASPRGTERSEPRTSQESAGAVTSRQGERQRTQKQITRALRLPWSKSGPKATTDNEKSNLVQPLAHYEPVLAGGGGRILLQSAKMLGNEKADLC